MSPPSLLLVLVATVFAVGCDEVVATPVAPPAVTTPVVQCIGVPKLQCDQLTDLGPALSGALPVAIRILCTKPPCTDARGEVSVETVYTDGTRQTSGAGWAQAEPAFPGKPNPVQPTEPPVAPSQG